jgi:hypothetical protein
LRVQSLLQSAADPIGAHEGKKKRDTRPKKSLLG